MASDGSPKFGHAARNPRCTPEKLGEALENGPHVRFHVKRVGHFTTWHSQKKHINWVDHLSPAGDLTHLCLDLPIALKAKSRNLGSMSLAMNGKGGFPSCKKDIRAQPRVYTRSSVGSF